MQRARGARTPARILCEALITNPALWCESCELLRTCAPLRGSAIETSNPPWVPPDTRGTLANPSAPPDGSIINVTIPLATHRQQHHNTITRLPLSTLATSVPRVHHRRLRHSSVGRAALSGISHSIGITHLTQTLRPTLVDPDKITAREPDTFQRPLRGSAPH